MGDWEEQNTVESIAVVGGGRYWSGAIAISGKQNKMELLLRVKKSKMPFSSFVSSKKGTNLVFRVDTQ